MEWSYQTRGCFLLLLVLLLGACFVGCGEDFEASGEGYVLDSQDRLEDAVTVKPGAAVILSGEGTQLIADQFFPLARNLLELPEEGPFDLSPVINGFLEDSDPSTNNFTVSDVVFQLDFPGREEIRLSFLPDPTRLRVEIDEIWINVEGTATQAESPGSFACRVRGKVERGTPNQRMFTLSNIRIDLALIEEEGRFNVQASDFDFQILESGVDVVADDEDPEYYCNYPECSDGITGCAECHAVCGGASLIEDVVNFFAEYLDGLLLSFLQRFANVSIGSFDRLGGEFHPAVLLAGTLPDTIDAQRVAFELEPSSEGFKVVGNEGGEPGDLAMQLDFASAPLKAHPCIGEDPGSPSFEVSAPPSTRDFGLPQPHIAGGLAAGTINQLFWGFYRAGGLCLQISSEDITRSSVSGGGDTRLTASTLNLILPGLERVVGKDAPILISLQPYLDPNSPEVIKLGTGQGEGEERDSILKLLLPPLEISVHAWVEGRWLRLFGVEAGIDLGLSPVLRTDQILDVSIDHLEVTNLTQTYNELFPNTDLSQLFQFVLEAALGSVTESGTELPLGLEDLLSGSLGLPLELSITDLRPAENNRDWILLGARFEDIAQNASAIPGGLHTEVMGAPAEPLVGQEPLLLDVRAWSEIGFPVDNAEVQVRVDHGPWDGFRSAGVIEVKSAMLRTPGKHLVEVRSREKGDWRSLDLNPTTIEVEVVERRAPLARRAEEPPHEPAAQSEGGCSVTTTRSPGGSLWLLWAVVLGMTFRSTWKQRAFLGGMIATLLFGACSEDKPAATEGTVSCQGDEDCADGESCGADGQCFQPVTCSDDADCCANETCQSSRCEPIVACRNDDDCASSMTCRAGECRFDACSSDNECASGQVCQAGACLIESLFPCPSGCGGDEVCLGPVGLCVQAPDSCGGMTCPLGQVLVADNTLQLLGPSCDPGSVSCSCEGALSPAVSGDPTGYIRALSYEGGRVLIAAYDVAYRDLTVRWLDPNAADPGPVYYLAGHDGEQSTLPETLRGNLPVGPDVGAELDVAIAEGGEIGIVALDRSNDVLIMVWSEDGESWNRVGVDAQGGRTPDIEARPGGGWVIAYQSVERLGDEGDDYRTELKVATSDHAQVFALSDFEITTLDAGVSTLYYPDIPAGVGATPSLAYGDGRWFLAFQDTTKGALKVSSWTRLPEIQTATVLTATARADFPGGSTGQAPQLLVAPDGSLDVAYVDTLSGELRHAHFGWNEGEVENLVVSTVDAGLGGFPQRSIALDMHFARARSGALVMAYQDASQADLYVSMSSPEAEGIRWSGSRIDADGSTGFFPQIVTNGQESILIYGRWIFPESGRIEQSLVIQSL